MYDNFENFLKECIFYFLFFWRLNFWRNSWKTFQKKSPEYFIKETMWEYKCLSQIVACERFLNLPTGRGALICSYRSLGTWKIWLMNPWNIFWKNPRRNFWTSESRIFKGNEAISKNGKFSKADLWEIFCKNPWRNFEGIFRDFWKKNTSRNLSRNLWKIFSRKCCTLEDFDKEHAHFYF